MTYRSQPISKLSSYAPHRRLLLVLAGIAFAVISLQLANLSIRGHQSYLNQARENLYSYRRLNAPRGNIYDREGRTVATNRRKWSLLYTPYGRYNADAKADLKEIQKLIGVPDDRKIEEILVTRPRWTRHWIVRGSEQPEVLPVLERINEFPGLQSREEFTREYVYPQDMAHVTGYVSKIQPGETETYARPRYLPDDEVGRTGIERAFQDSLASHPGRERGPRNARVRQAAELEILEEARPGKDLHLTIDAELQGYAMELLAEYTGTAILMDAQTGEILVLASTPTFNAQNPAQQFIGDTKAGFLNLAVRGQYPAGSPFKIVGAAAALRAGVSPNEKVMCNGAFYLPGWERGFHCSHRNGHGPLGLVESIEMSCNVYYFEMAQRLGPEAMHAMAEEFGFGEPTGTDVPGENGGALPSAGELKPGELTNYSIGQGKMLVTPLQVARAYAAVANGGTLPVPHVVKNGGGEGRKINVPARDLMLIREGLRRVVSEPEGTAYEAEFPRHWEVAGKTGTVERGNDRLDAWFTGFFPASHPGMVFVVHLEKVDTAGGDIAAPIARELIAGYLGERETAKTDDVSVAANE